jgi:predicted TIM-barrel fold metal-dependent hydrolase
MDPILEASRAYPDRFIPFYAPDPVDPGAKEKLTEAMDKGIKGCGELKVSLKWEDTVVEAYLRIIETLGLPLVFHMENPRMHYVPEGKGFVDRVFERLLNDKYNGVSRHYLSKLIASTGIYKRKVRNNRIQFPGYLYDFAALEKRISQFPGIRFIAHGPDFWNAISPTRDPKYIHQPGRYDEFGITDRLLETYENLYCDISGFSAYNALSRDRDMARRFLDKHASKILFGTDNTDLGLEKLLEKMNLTRAKRELIFHRNAEMLIHS